MDNEEKDIILLEKFLMHLAGEVERSVSTNIAISLYDIIGEFFSDEKKFELKIARFFAGMPDKLMLLHRVIGDISIVRHEIMKGGAKTAMKQKKLEEFFADKSAELNKKW